MIVKLGKHGEFRAYAGAQGVSAQWWPIPNLRHYTLTLWWGVGPKRYGRLRLRRYGAWEKKP